MGRHGMSARAPAKSLEVDAAVLEHHAFRFEQGLLAGRIGDRDAPRRVDDAMPRQPRAGGQPGQRQPDLARASGQAGEFGDLAIGRDRPGRDGRGDLPDTLAKVYACDGRLRAGGVHG